MTFLTLLKWDLKQQFRYKFWHAGSVLTMVWILLFKLIPPEQTSLWLAIVLFADTCTMGLLFIAGLLFLELRQGSVFAVAVTPLPTHLWLLSKIVSLTIFCTFFSMLIILFSANDVDWLRLIPALALSAALYTLIGFMIAAPFRSVTSYFPMMSLVTGVTGLPILWRLGLMDHGLLWLIPAHPAMVAISSGLDPKPMPEYLIAMGLLVLWAALAFWLCLVSYKRFITDRRGA